MSSLADASAQIRPVASGAFVPTPFSRHLDGNNTVHSSSVLVRIWPILSAEEIKGRPSQGLQEMNGGVGCSAASRLSHCCVIKSNPRTLLRGR